jgi:galactonate dehydratase
VEIVDLDVVRVAVNHRGDWLFVRIVTDDGLVGLGEASHGAVGPNRDEVVMAILLRQCRPILEGRDPRDVVAATAALSKLVRGHSTGTAVSACEQALWDLAGQAAGLPVYRLLGGPTRTAIPLYANINRATKDRTPDAFAQNAKAAVGEGFTAIKCAPFDGMNRARVRERDQRERVRHGLACVKAIRDAIGPDIDLFVDCHSFFDLPTSMEVANALRELGVSWFEEPLPTPNIDELARLRPLVPDLELIGGETLYGIEGFWPYLNDTIWDLIMPDVKHCGGIAALCDIARCAQARGVAVAPHNPSGPVAMAASAQAAAALPNIRFLEYAWGEVPWRADLLSPCENIKDGQYILPAGPGLGIKLNDSTVAAHAVTPGGPSYE